VCGNNQEDRLGALNRWRSQSSQPNRGFGNDNLAHASEDVVVNQARGRDAVFSAAIGTDKMQLLRNLPTSIIETVERHDVAIILQSALSEAIDLTLDELA
jgi:hypothetical protein